MVSESNASWMLSVWGSSHTGNYRNPAPAHRVRESSVRYCSARHQVHWGLKKGYCMWQIWRWVGLALTRHFQEQKWEKETQRVMGKGFRDTSKEDILWFAQHWSLSTPSPIPLTRNLFSNAGKCSCTEGSCMPWSHFQNEAHTQHYLRFD